MVDEITEEVLAAAAGRLVEALRLVEFDEVGAPRTEGEATRCLLRAARCLPGTGSGQATTSPLGISSAASRSADRTRG